MMIASVTREQVERYLRWSGWQEQPSDAKAVIFYKHADRLDDSDEPIVLALPARETTDVDIRVAQMLESLAAIENRPFQTLVASIQLADRDILRLALLTEQGFRRGVPLQTAPEIVTNLRDLVSHAATNEIAPSAYHPRITDAGKRHAERCLFGHTFEGSFGFTVETPLPIGDRRKIPLLTPEEIERPFERRVTERLAAGIRYLEVAAEAQSIEVLVDHVGEGLNSNMCEALLEIGGFAHGTPTTYSISWSPEWPALERLTHFAPVRIDNRGYRCLESFIREVRPAEGPTEVSITGRVVILKSEEPPLIDDTAEHEIVVAAEIEEHKYNVHVALAAAEYREACDAHLAGTNIAVRGMLEKRGRYWTLTSPRGFHVVTESE